MRKLVAIFVVVFTLSPSANAVLIDNGLYLTDTVSGLDWLKLTNTINRSYDDISSQLTVGGEFAGWQYASGAQFESLLLGQGITADLGCIDGTNFCGGTNPANTSVINNLVNTLGDTFEQAHNGGVLTSNANAALGLLNDANSGNSHHIGLLVGSYLSDVPYARTHYGDPQQDGISASHIGSFLIRPSVVPVPASIYLLGSAVVGLFNLRRFSKT